MANFAAADLSCWPAGRHCTAARVGEMAQICWQTDARNCTRPCLSNRATPGQQLTCGSNLLAQDTCLADNPVIAVPADAALPAELVQPGAHLAGVDEDFDQAVLGAVAEPPPDDFVAARHIGLLAVDVRMLVDEEHTARPGNQASQLPPELSEPAGRH